MSFALVTDSAGSLPYTLCNELNLTVLPLSYFVDEAEHKGYFKDKPVDLKAFYESMRNGSSVRTSLPTPSETRVALVELLEKGLDVLYLGFSSGLSGTFDSVHGICEALRSEYPERRIVCEETIAASFGQGLIVKKAALMKRAGSTIDEIVTWVQDHRMFAVHWITVDDLSYVLGGGRLGAGAAKAANFLNLKPLLRIDEEGKVAVAGKARGRKKSLKLMADKVKETFDINMGKEIVIAHADSANDAYYLMGLIKAEVGPECQCEIEYLDPVIGAHGGPDSMAVFFFGHHR